jgi:PAS domain S-box-containing protein
MAEYAFCRNREDFRRVTDKALSRIGMEKKAERAYLFLFRDGMLAIENEWLAPGVPSRKGSLPEVRRDDVPWWMKRLQDGPFCINEVTSLPREAAGEQSLLLSHGIRSAAAFPVDEEGIAAGFVVLENLPEPVRDTGQDLPLVSSISRVMGKTLELIRSEEELRTTKNRYQSIVETQSELIFRFLPDCTISFCNPAYARYIGGKPEDFIGRNLGEVRNKDVSYLIKTYSGLTPESPGRLFENSTIMADGTVKWQLWNDTAFFDESGKLKEIQSVGWDITELKKVKRVGEMEKKKALTLFEHSPEGLLASWDGILVNQVNDAFCRITGLSPEEILGKPLAENFFADTDEEACRLKSLLRKANFGDSALEEGPFTTKSGTTLYLSVLALPLPDASDQGKGFYLFFRDLTAIKEKEKELLGSIRKLHTAFSQTIDVLAQTVESRDPYTAGHQRRTALLSAEIARRMCLGEETGRGISMAAAIHDVGKISVPSEILSKPGVLHDVEMALVRTHSEEGYQILKKVDFPWRIAEIVRQHHERIDGSGYPRGLKNGEILLEAKILAVADTVEAMASHRPYRPSLGTEAALRFVEEGKGLIFDGNVVEACREVFADGFSFGE